MSLSYVLAPILAIWVIVNVTRTRRRSTSRIGWSASSLAAVAVITCVTLPLVFVGLLTDWSSSFAMVVYGVFVSFSLVAAAQAVLVGATMGWSTDGFRPVLPAYLALVGSMGAFLLNILILSDLLNLALSLGVAFSTLALAMDLWLYRWSSRGMQPLVGLSR